LYSGSEHLGGSSKSVWKKRKEEVPNLLSHVAMDRIFLNKNSKLNYLKFPGSVPPFCVPDNTGFWRWARKGGVKEGMTSPNFNLS
jgi:hypothetical protein